MARITNYFKETRAELRHVNWPTRKQAAVFTVLVIAVSLFTALYLGALDFIFSGILRFVI